MRSGARTPARRAAVADRDLVLRQRRAARTATPTTAGCGDAGVVDQVLDDAREQIAIEAHDHVRIDIDLDGRDRAPRTAHGCRRALARSASMIRNGASCGAEDAVLELVDVEDRRDERQRLADERRRVVEVERASALPVLSPVDLLADEVRGSPWIADRGERRSWTTSAARTRFFSRSSSALSRSARIAIPDAYEPSSSAHRPGCARPLWPRTDACPPA